MGKWEKINGNILASWTDETSMLALINGGKKEAVLPKLWQNFLFPPMYATLLKLWQSFVFSPM